MRAHNTNHGDNCAVSNSNNDNNDRGGGNNNNRDGGGGPSSPSAPARRACGRNMDWNTAAAQCVCVHLYVPDPGGGNFCVSPPRPTCPAGYWVVPGKCILDITWIAENGCPADRVLDPSGRFCDCPPGEKQLDNGTCTIPPPPEPTPKPRPLSAVFGGNIFADRAHLLASQIFNAAAPTLKIEVAVVPAGVAATNTAVPPGTTLVWPPVTRVELWAVMDRPLACADARGIVGGCASLPRAGHRLRLHTLDAAAVRGQLAGDTWDPCAVPVFGGDDPAAIEINRDVANELLAVRADGRGGGPGIWKILATVRTAAVPAGSCTPPTANTHPAAVSTVTAPDAVRVALRLADTAAD